VAARKRQYSVLSTISTEAGGLADHAAVVICHCDLDRRVLGLVQSSGLHENDELDPRKPPGGSEMLISDKINHAFNEQIGHELGNSNQYLAIGSYFERESLFGLAKIYQKQAEEERTHALKFVKFLQDAGGKVAIPAIPAPRNEFESAVEAAQQALESELLTTRQIYDLVNLVTEEKNYIALNFLQWFVNEQLEEVSSAQTRLAVIRRAGQSVLMVEAYLAHE
jgi:ferritin